MSKSFVFDTNPLVSAFLFWNSIPKAAYNKAVKTGSLVASTDTHAEFEEVFFRPKFDKYILFEDRLEVSNEFKEILVFAEIKERINACGDPKDNKFLELAVAAKVSCIITGDNDLLSLHPFRKIPIVNAADFLITF